MTLKKVVNSRREYLKTFALIFAVLLLSLFPRLWKLTIYPPIVVDEPAYLRDINQMLSLKNFYPANFQWDGSQASLAYLPTIFLRKTVITDQFLALRLTSVIMSLLALVPFFYLLKKYTNKIVALSCTTMFSFSYYFLQFSRVGWGVILPITLGLYLMWTIESIDEKSKISKVIIAGIIAGLISYLYRAGEIYIAGGFLFFIIKNISFKINVVKKIINILIFILFFLLIAAPWIIKISSNYNFFLLRQRAVAINNVNVPYHGFYEKRDILLYQATSAVKSWIFLLPVDTKNVENPRYLPKNYTLINPLLIPLFLMGLFLCLNSKFKKMYPWIFIYLSGIIFGQILTVDPPNGARGLILLPIIYIFIGYSLNWTYGMLRDVKGINIIFISISVIIAVTDFLTYQYWMTWIKV